MRQCAPGPSFSGDCSFGDLSDGEKGMLVLETALRSRRDLFALEPFSRPAPLKLGLVEQKSRDGPDDQQDIPPEPGRIGDRSAFLRGPDDHIGHLCRGRP